MTLGLGEKEAIARVLVAMKRRWDALPIGVERGDLGVAIDALDAILRDRIIVPSILGGEGAGSASGPPEGQVPLEGEGGERGTAPLPPPHKVLARVTRDTA